MRKDDFIHKGKRKNLVELIKKKGISDYNVLQAINKVPRHLFIDSFIEHKAYEDIALPIEEGQTISQPYTVAFQSELLDIKQGDKILEVGTGSGYQAAILYEMGARVFTIERQKNLYAKTMNLFIELGYSRIQCFYGDGYKGLVQYGPFDGIIVTAGAPQIPENLLLQLKIGAKMICPVGDNIEQIMYKITRIEEKKFKNENFGNFIFVPMLKGLN